VTFHSLRSIWTRVVLGFITAVFLASCGGGAATSTTGGTLQVFAPNTMFGGVAANITITGGRPPYLLASSEPAVLAVPSQTSSSTITVLPANPGVVDTGLQPTDLQVRTVNISVRDASGNSTVAVTKVGQNFLTGFGMSLGATTCTSATAAATAGTVCAGGDTTVSFAAVFNGNLFGGREFRLDVVQGNFTLVNPATGASGASIGVTTDHQGVASAIIRVAPNIPTQIGVIRLTDVASGASTFDSFIINGGSSTATLTALPNSFTFTGPDTNTCGTGSGDFLVFDGVPPYSAVSSDSNISVTFVDVSQNPGRFRVTASNPNVCITGGTIVVTDANNARTTVTVNTAKGTTPPFVPPTPLTVQPGSLTLGCAQAGSVLAIGGSSSSTGTGGGGGGATFSASSSNPDITATVSGGTVTITRAGPAGPGTGTSTSQVFITDGSQIATVSVTAPTTCP
jgi:hypothetical protein